MWEQTIDETKNPVFWICWHAAMLFLHGVISYEQFNEIYDNQVKKLPYYERSL